MRVKITASTFVSGKPYKVGDTPDLKTDVAKALIVANKAVSDSSKSPAKKADE